MIIQVFVHIGLLITYCDSFEAEHIPKETEKFIGHKNMKTNKFRIQSNNSIRCGHFCVGLIDFMLFVGKTLIDFTSLFSSFDFEKILFLFRLISAERYKNAQAYYLRIRNTDEIWV